MKRENGVQPLHIIHSCTSTSYSGLERYVVELATAQFQSGLSVEVFCRQGSAIADELTSRGVAVWFVPPHRVVTPLLWFRLMKPWNERLQKYVQHRVILHMHHAGELPIHKPWLNRVAKSILQFHLWITHVKRDPYHGWLYGGVSEVWCSSQPAKAMLSSLLPVKKNRFRVVDYGRDVARLKALPRIQLRQEARVELNIPADAVVGVCVSRLEPIKGVKELVQAFRQCAEQWPTAHLIIVGGPSPDNNEAVSFAAELHSLHEGMAPLVRERLHFVGFAPADRYMAAADFYILPSYEECMSLALLDALILGLPVVGTDAGGTPEVVRENETGWLVPARDAARLAQALGRAMGDSEGRRVRGIAAAAMGQHFDVVKVFESIKQAYMQ